jgi:hypothetical protein
MSLLQKGLSHREEAKASKKIENREDFLSESTRMFNFFQIAFEFP